MDTRGFRDKVFVQFARVGKALASEKRLELLDLLAQAPRRVDALAAESNMSVANVSQHLQVLLQARLVETEHEGTQVIYRLADDSVLRLWLALRTVADARLAELDQIKREFQAEEQLVPREEIEKLMKRGKAVLLDVRPPVEYASGHLPGSVSIPSYELEKRLGELPKDRPIVAYCRGEYCLSADESVALLRKHGFNAVRLEGGWPEWAIEGRKTER